MCGIVGLFAKSPVMEAELGVHLNNMLVEMTERGPDSAGIAIYRKPVPAGSVKLTVLAPNDAYDWHEFEKQSAKQLDDSMEMEIYANHAVLKLHIEPDGIYDWFFSHFPELHINSSGTTIEVFKDKGLPINVLNRFDLLPLAW